MAWTPCFLLTLLLHCTGQDVLSILTPQLTQTPPTTRGKCLSLLSFLQEITGVCVSGSLSQHVLTQLPSASASLGALAKLTCNLSSGYSTYSVDWYQQGPGKGPQFLM